MGRPNAPSTLHAGRQAGGAIRVLVVEDSASMRDLIVRLFRADGQFDVVGVARDGEEAVALTARLRPDVVTMDIHLPRLNGVFATRRIMAETPTPIVVVSASVEQKDVGLAFDALKAGAVAVLDKPPGPGDPRHAAAAREMLTTVRLMAQVKVVRRWATVASGMQPPKVASPPVPSARASRRRPQAIVVAASTGGPQAIQTLLQSLGNDLAVPILVVQHISDGFAAGMAAWLSLSCPQPVRLAEHGERPEGGSVYLAPGDRHLLVTRRGALALSKAPPDSGFRPSANLLFQSAAEYYGAQLVGVILTGMGDDGATGLATIRATGAVTIAQDEATSVVWGMPGAAVASGAAARVLPLTAIGSEIRALLGLESSTGPSASTRSHR